MKLFPDPYPVPKTLARAAICAGILFAAPLQADTVINGTQTVAAPGGAGSEWDYTNERITVGAVSDGELLVPAGAEVLAETLELATQPDVTGYVEIDGAGAAVRTSTDVSGDSQFIVGSEGEGEIAVMNGGVLSSRSTWLGLDEGSTGKITISGPDSVWESPGGWSWHIGDRGTGILEVSDGATVRNQAYLFVGNLSIENPTGSGNVVGGGIGTVKVLSGATVEGNSSSRIANQPGTQGTVIVKGEGSRYERGSWLHVGSSGAGVLEVTEGGAVIAEGSISIGGGRIDSVGSTGDVYVSGPGSVVQCPNGWIYVGREGEATLLAENGATVSTGTHFRVGHSPTSVGEATFTGEGTVLDVGSYSQIGSQGIGTLHILDGARMKNLNHNLNIARDPGSEGTLNVSGGGIVEAGNNIYVGRQGLGTLNVTSGGTVIGTDDLRIGDADIADGYAIVSGAGSEIAVLGALRMAATSGDDPAGNLAAATLFIEDGGTVHASGGSWIRNESSIELAGGTLSGGRIHVMDSSSVTGEGTINATLFAEPSATLEGTGAGLSIATLASGSLSNGALGGIDISAKNGSINLSHVTMGPNSVIDVTIDWTVDEPLITFDANTDLSAASVTVAFDPIVPNETLTFRIFEETSGTSDYTFASVSTPDGWELQEGVLLYTGVVHESEFETWTSDYGLTGADAEMDANPSGDGFSNLAKFAFGGDPTAPTAALAEVSREGDPLVLRWNRRTGSGVRYVIENSATLGSGTWRVVRDANPVVVVTPDVQPPAGYERVEWTVDVSAAGARSFYRLNALIGDSRLDVLFINGTVIDGSGAERYLADVGISGDSIQVIGQDLEMLYEADRVVDIAGKFIAPGYIDVHTHADGVAFGDDQRRKAALNFLYQGITTINIGADGRHSRRFEHQKEGQISKLYDFLDANGFGMNVFLLLGHNNIRTAVMGSDYSRFSTETEMEEMGTYVRQYMEEGALGMSLGLEYDSGRYSDVEELVYLANVLGDYDKRSVIVSHERATGPQHRY